MPRTQKIRKYRSKIKRKQKNICAYCELSLHGIQSTIEHIVSQAWGGPGMQFNLVVVCYNCNSNKSDWENLISNRFRHLSGQQKCFHLIKWIENRSIERRKQFGERKALFKNIPKYLWKTINHSDWDKAALHKQYIFRGN